MIEPAQLLKNMSAPSKSVVKYTGLSGSATMAGTRGTRIRNIRSSHDGVFGAFIVFRFAQGSRPCAPGTILNHLEIDPGPEPEKTLVSLIEQRARELILPDACVVVPDKQNHPCPWPDPLAALAIITKSSGHVWLRSKSPRLSAIKTRSEVSLLIPPVYSARIEELSK
jgi:hypothetical protein